MTKNVKTHGLDFFLATQYDWVLKRVIEGVQRIASSLQRRCTFKFVSFGAASSGKRSHEFLVRLCDAAKSAGAEADAIDTETSTERLGSVLTSVLSTATAHCTALGPGQRLEPRRLLAVDTSLRLQDEIQHLDQSQHPNLKDFDVVSASKNSLGRVLFKKIPDQRHREAEPIPLQSEVADGLAVCKQPFGQGGERFAFIAREVRGANDPSTCRFVGAWLVAKKSSRIRSEAERGFHVMYTKLQKTADRLARKFNERLLFLENVLSCLLPRVEFLECSVYSWKREEREQLEVKTKEYEVQWLKTEAECLVEPLLDASKEFVKFNSNSGYVGEGAAKEQRQDWHVNQMMRQSQG